MRSKILLSLFFLAILVQPSFAQKLEELQWSSWVPVLDRNENKVQVSITFVEQKGEDLGYYDQNKKIPTFHYKLRNKYKEPISGRIVFDYQSMNGDDLQMSCVIYNLQPDVIYSLGNFSGTYAMFEDPRSLRFVKSVSNFRFVEFQPESKTSSLISFTASDSVIFRMYSEIKQQEAYKTSLASSNEKGAVTIKDNSDSKIYFKGQNETQIASLLSKVKGWTTNSGLNVKNGIPPKLDINGECQRDQYVYSALLYSWAAESYFRINETKKANEASAKVSELLNLATQLCSNGGIHFQDGSCKTESIFPCSGANTGSNIQQSTPSTAKLSSTQPNQQSASGDNGTDFKNEKELFGGLLPVLASLNSNDYNQQATSISGFMDNLVTYSEKSDVDPITSIGLKLAALDVKVQAAELSGNNNSFLNSLSALNGSATNTKETSSGSLNSSYGIQSSYQQQLQLQESLTQFADQLMKWTDPDHPTNNQLNRQAKLRDVIYNRNEDYREKYGYTVKDFTDAIRNFDDALLDKILSTGFPVDTKVIHDNQYTEVQLGDYYGSDYCLNGLHYACIYGNEFAVNRFIEKGMDINEIVKGYKGSGVFVTDKEFSKVLGCVSPLDLAVLFNQYKVAKLLLSKGAKIRHKPSLVIYNWGGWTTCYNMAKKKNYYDIVRLLEKYSDK